MPSLSYKTALADTRERFAELEALKILRHPKGAGELLSYFNRLTNAEMARRYAAMQVALHKERTPAERMEGVPVMYMNLYEKDTTAFSYVFVDSLAKNGFLVRKNHNLSIKVRDNVLDATEELFEQSKEYTDRYVVPGSGGQRGVIDYGTEIHKGSDNLNGDMKYSFSIGPECGPGLSPVDAMKHGILSNVWPDRPSGFREKMLAYQEEMHREGRLLQKILSVGLGLPENFLEEKMRFGDHLLRTHLYPARAAGLPDTGGEGIATHTDRCFITELHAREKQHKDRAKRRLIVKPDLHDKRTWIAVDTSGDVAITNAGKAADRVTGGFLCATWHGVVNALDPGEKRGSGPEFFWLSYKELVFDVICPPGRERSQTQKDLSAELQRDYPTGKATFGDLRRGMSMAGT